MKFVALTTVRDDGAAQMAKDVLSGRDIPVELRRLSQMVYLGSAPAQVEVRVPEDRLEEARLALAQLEVDIEQAVIAEAGAPPEDAPPSTAATDETGRPRRIGWAIAFALIAPVPWVPIGMIYARAPMVLNLALMAIGGGSALLTVVGAGLHKLALVSFLGTRAVDVVLAPIFAARENRRLAKLGIDVPTTRLPRPLIALIVLLVALFAAGLYLAATREPYSEYDASQS